MPALPTVGASNNTWGDELNEFLGVSLNAADGTLKQDSVTGPLTLTDPGSGNSGYKMVQISGGNDSGTALTDQALYSSWLIQNGASPAAGYRPWDLLQTITKTDGAAGDSIRGLGVTTVMGAGGAAAIGTPHGLNSVMYVRGCGSDSNEHAAYYGALNAEIGTGFTQTAAPAGDYWMTDWSIQGPIAVQPKYLNGITQLVNNYYNGSPLSGPSAAIWAVTKAGAGGSIGATHAAGTTYPLDIGIGIAGISSGSAVGFTSALKIGGTGSAWAAASRFTNAIEIADFDTYGIKITAKYTASTPSAAIAVATGIGGLLIGQLTHGTAGTEFEVQGAAAGANPLVIMGSNNYTADYGIAFRNASGIGRIFVAGATNSFLTGTAAGDQGWQINTTAKSFHIGGTTKVITVTVGNTLGFFAASPIAQYATTGTLTGFTAATTTPVLDGSTFTGNTGSTAYTIGDIVRALKLYGIMAA